MLLRSKNLLLLLTSLSLFFGSCKVDTEPKPTTEDPTTEEPAELKDTPFTDIPEEMVGTWYDDGNDGPLTENWEKGTFQGEQGFKEFRTMVFTGNGKSAVEYTTHVVNSGDEVQRNSYKITGTLEYKPGLKTLQFHPQGGVMRVFSNKYAGYKEGKIAAKDLRSYVSILSNPEATSFTSSANYLTAKRVDGGNQYSVRYRKVATGTAPTTPKGPLTSPPATGTYIKIGSLYYPTVTIGDREWMTVNYAGPGGITDSDKPEYGTFFKYADLGSIQIPAGWRIPNKEDYVKLIKSQGIEYDEYLESTDGDDVKSKRLLGQLMAATGWLKEDGYANNTSGFNAVPANMRVVQGTAHGEGYNCLLWTSEKDDRDNPFAFKIIQLPSDTYARFGTYPVGYNTPHLPVRFVKSK
jgi:uncharacterized protein (TIGR02145 family)